MDWISVEDRLPPKDGEVLVMYKTGLIAQAQERTGFYGEPTPDEFAWRCSCCGRYAHEITHWMPLPAPPKEEP